MNNNKCGCEEIPCTTPDCSCKVFITTDCVTLSEDLTCSNIAKGQTETEVLKQLDAYICARFETVENFLTIVNVGTGAGVYKGISVLGKKELKSLVDSNLINIVNGTDEITISIDETALSTFIVNSQKTYSSANVGTGAQVYKDSTVVGDNTQFNLRKIKSSDSSVSISEGIDDIDLTVSITGTVPDATATVKGKLKLTNDLGGTADLPTTPTAVHLAVDETITSEKIFSKNLIFHYDSSPSDIVGGVAMPNGGTNIVRSFYRGDTGSNIFITRKGLTGAGYTGGAINMNISNSTGIVINGDNTANTALEVDTSSAQDLTRLNTSVSSAVQLLLSYSGAAVLTDSDIAIKSLSSGSDLFTISKTGVFTGKSFIKVGGTSNQYLMANGTVKEHNPQKVITYPTDFTGTNYILTDADRDYTIFVDNGSTAVTITANTSITLSNYCVGFIQEGSANITFVGTGITLTNPIGMKSKGQGYQTFIERKLATSTFYLLGNTKV